MRTKFFTVGKEVVNKEREKAKMNLVVYGLELGVSI